MKKSALTILLLILVIAALSVVKTFVANRISTSGMVLGAIEDKISYYKTENALLSEKLYTMSSLTTISGEAENLGFVEEKTNFVLTNPLPIALKQ